jgi:magnesium chelatase family protein
LLDRIDLQVLVPAVPWQELSANRRGEPSADVAGRVHAARQLQYCRYSDTGLTCNGEMGPAEIVRWAQPDVDGRRLLEHASRKLGLSARAYHRILRVARTIADLAGEEKVLTQHLAEAVAYRALDRQAAGQREGAAPAGDG